ncbi:MAG: 5-formyltetrahydrofolate cyclo-ligase [Rhizomicrobium sp.]
MIDKVRLRKIARSRRATLSQDIPDFAERLAGVDLPLPPGSCVAGYWPLAGEADPRLLMAALQRRGHTLALPCIVGPDQPLIFRGWRIGDPLVAGTFGTSEPPASCPQMVPQVLLVPLLAFDIAGYRLGYGGGYYDRSLAELRESGTPLAVGIAFAGQEVDAVPVEATDQRLDLVISEAGLRHFPV